MSLLIDSRKNRSSSTIETSGFSVMPPLGVRTNLPRGRPTTPSLARDHVNVCKNVTAAMPVLRKLWLISRRDLRGACAREASALGLCAYTLVYAEHAFQGRMGLFRSKD